MSKTESLIGAFLDSARRSPDHPALVVNGSEVTYRELARRARTLADAIISSERDGRPLAAFLAHRSETAFASALAVLAAGKGYLPLNPKFPAERTARTLAAAGSEVLIVGAEGEEVLPGILDSLERDLVVILADRDDDGGLGDRYPRHRIAVAPGIDPSAEVPEDPAVLGSDYAYLLFTSGSTGEPKGVPITHDNARAYVRHTAERLGVTREDRCSQMHDLTFDFSVHDLWVCWEGGATLFCVPERALFAPAKFIRTHGLTLWASVPSVVALMKKMGMLKPGAFPTLRRTIFCGEALPRESAEAWQDAAPDCLIENTYGPTEATVAITAYPWDPESSSDDCAHGIVPIGWPFPDQRCRVVDEDGRDVETGTAGELCLAGSQVSEGYWEAPALTREKFVQLPEDDDVTWYRTGDLARRDEDGCLHFAGRIDDQVKIRGFRVELQEIDHAIRSEFDAHQVASVAWPVRNGSAEGVVVFTSGGEPPAADAVVAVCRQRMPEYMVPRRVIHLDRMPLNRNQKIDRGRLREMLERGEV